MLRRCEGEVDRQACLGGRWTERLGRRTNDEPLITDPSLSRARSYPASQQPPPTPRPRPQPLQHPRRVFNRLPVAPRRPSPSLPTARRRRTTTAMPTPESEAFLAKKPKVAPTFDGVDYDDNAALKAAQDAVIREQWVKSMMARLVREEMSKCYYREGVNHLEKCGHLRGQSR